MVPQRHRKKMGPVKSILSLSLSLSIKLYDIFYYIGLVVDLPSEHINQLG